MCRICIMIQRIQDSSDDKNLEFVAQMLKIL